MSKPIVSFSTIKHDIPLCPTPCFVKAKRITKSEFIKRRKKKRIKKLTNQTPWQEISRSNVGQLEDGACIMSRDQYLDITKTKGVLRNSH